MRKNTWIYLLVALFCVSCSVDRSKDESLSFRLMPALGDAPLSKQFRVSVNGKDAVVEKMEKIDIPIHYVQIVYDGTSPLQVSVRVDNPIQNYTVSPMRKNIKANVSGNQLSFAVDSAAYLLVKINDLEDLYLLINPKVDYQAQVSDKEIVNILSFGIDSTGTNKETEKSRQPLMKSHVERQCCISPKGNTIRASCTCVVI